MKKLIGFVGLILLLGCSRGLDNKRLLVFVDPKTTLSTQEVEKLRQVAEAQEIIIDTTSNAALLKEDTLKYYSAVVFSHFSGSRLDYLQQTALERYVQAGGALVGIGTNIKPEFQWPWHTALENALQSPQALDVPVNQVSDQTEGEAGKGEAENALSEVKFNFDGGRILFLPSLSAYDANQISEVFEFAIDDNVIDYKKARSLPVPEATKFTRIVLDDQLNEPMELDVMPDGRVIYIQRRGEVKLYNPETKLVKLLATFDVTTEGNYEDGLLGVAIDPGFERNNHVYFYYSAPDPDSLNRLSRFRMLGDSLLLNSEKTILEVPVQRKTCCHTGGAIQFGPDGLLYLSTGDNTSSKESDGYTPIDERPGRGPYDAQKSSGNTMDLRGKILRIKVNSDGSYSIPEGNLFPANGIEGRPEIYIMGVRNPFRFSIDWKNNWVYWGDVGPDVGKASEQGPESYDEWNQAREAGNYGWPYFVADNKAYPEWDFDTNTPGAYFDPENPVNDSPNNTGSKKLPTAKPAMMWYPYGDSEVWPNLGTGSRSAMAGPVYYSDRYRSDVKFPEYYDGKLFIFEWARSWIKVVTFNEQGEPVKLEPFLPEMPISKPIDLEFGPDGAMYFLDYGANYFADNDEARLVKIEYTEGNRKPVAVISADKRAGAAPLKVQFSALRSYDYDEADKLSFEWKFEGSEVQATEAEPVHTFEEPGKHKATLTVRDNHGNSRTAEVELLVGNAPPVIEIAFEGNQSFYYDNTELAYQISVSDQEDGSTGGNKIDPSAVLASFDYLKESKDLALLGNATRVSPFIKGKNLIDGSDCSSCHDMEKASIGPSYLQVAERYQGESGAVPMLAEKIILGGNGNWGHSLMAAHPQLSEEDATEMVKYILSLAEDTNEKNLSLKGSLLLNKHNPEDESGTYYMTVSYTDKGANNMPAITSRKMVTLQNPKVQAEAYQGFKEVSRLRPQGGAFAYVGGIKDGSYMEFKNIDLKEISEIIYRIEATNEAAEGAVITLRLGSPTGDEVSRLVFSSANSGEYQEITAPVMATEGLHDLYVVFNHDTNKEHALFNLDWIYFKPGSKLVP